MQGALTAAAILANLSITAGLFVLLIILCVGFLALLAYWLLALAWWPRHARPKLHRSHKNPILRPDPEHWWESEAVFNPGAFVLDGKVHLVYRALGSDGISRFGYATSVDGVHFSRLPFPVYDRGPGFFVGPARKYRALSYDTDNYASGGGWGGTEDPRCVVMDDTLYMTFGIFESWQSMRMALATLPVEHLLRQEFDFSPHITMSPKEQTNKNWVLFPEKIGGRFAILHALTPHISIEYIDDLGDLRKNPIQSNNHRTGRKGAWDAFVRGAAAPPIKTPYGWLLLYHGMNPDDGTGVGYRVGAMLLDLADPTKVLYRSGAPILEPKEWYENDWKPGVVYASGAVVFNGDLIVYYGGGDKYIAAAKMNLNEFLHRLIASQPATLEPVRIMD